MADEQDVKIAVLDTKMEGLREQGKAQFENLATMLKDQNDRSDARSAKLLDYIKPAVEFAMINKELPSQVKILWDERNNSRGFLSAAKLLNGFIGGGIALVGEWFVRK